MSKATKKEILGISTLTYKYQITIPKRVREKHGLSEGDTIVFVEEDARVYLTKSTGM